MNSHKRNKEVTKEDIFDRLVSLRKPAQMLFVRLKSTYDYKYNTAYITRESSEKDNRRGPYKTLMNNIRSLEKAELALRVPSAFYRTLKIQQYQDYTFLLNPYFIHPNELEIVWKVWDELAEEHGIAKVNLSYPLLANNQ
ncbi:hypothetical protein D210916BOD24_15630 [Alteromonas sp. D210916BOD_24]|uniref:hypothetical protein n=1 Tax=Alteromonas sp. D210916BOD_24 TaxID=3157618 RepID=UPI00399C7B4C